MNVSQGFPAKGSGVGAAERGARNKAMSATLRDLDGVDGLADALDAARALPPARYADDAWEFIAALLEVLPRVAAELTLVFRAAGAIDFTQGTLAALEALGDADSPSDLLLGLDCRIRHLLVDEFQDTSYTQLELIRRLTSGWEPGDGRTLFAVGDPMQSIYRFRGAEVRLFVTAQETARIGELPVETIVLRRNFRSQARLVEWTNLVFPGVLGLASDPWRGVVGFVPAVAARDALPRDAVTLRVLPDAESEASAIVGYVAAALANEAEDVAVLVRSRAHLEVLLPVLRTAGIAYAAVELDALGERAAVQDLVSLTHALVQPADRLAWLAVLRAPWCGLALPDLLAVAIAADTRNDGSIAGLMPAADSIGGLTADGRTRLARVAPVLAAALAARGRASVALRVRGAWLALGGGATIEEQIDLDAVERFLALLGKHDVAGDVPDWPALIDALGKLHAAPGPTAGARVQVMTLHRAKGLEFDTVILPGLARLPNRGGMEILRWRRRPRGLLLAPMKARGADADPVYTYLKRLADGEDDAELGRLLYVGCTRARRRLHLTGVLETRTGDDVPPAWRPPPTGSALAKFWPALGDVLPPHAAMNAVRGAVFVAAAAAPFAADVVDPGAESGVPAATGEFVFPRDGAVRLGTRRCEACRHDHPSPASADRAVKASPRGTGCAWHRSPRASRPNSRPRVSTRRSRTRPWRESSPPCSRLLADRRGRWLFDPAHAEAISEWALAGWDGKGVAHISIDRTFVTDGVRWIVDFKTGAHEGAEPDAFLDRERERYRGQLERYAAFVRALDSRPIRLALYHPLQGGWREWPYDG